VAACNCDAMVAFNTPLRGQHVLTLLGAEQTTSLLVVMIRSPFAQKNKNHRQVVFVFGGSEGDRYVVVLIPSSRNQAAVHWTAAF